MAVRMWRKDWAGADLHLAEAERVFRDYDYDYGLSFVLDARAFVALQRGDWSRLKSWPASRCASWRRRDEWLASRSLRVLGLAAARGNAFERAVRLFAASDALLASVGARGLTGEREHADKILQQARGNLAESVFERAHAEGSGMDFHRALAYAATDAVSGTNATDAAGAGAADDTQVRTNAPVAAGSRLDPDPAPRQQPTARLRVLNAAVALYRGDFLEYEGTRDWYLEYRDHLHRLYIDALSALGEILILAGDYTAATETCRRILARDNLREDAHRRLILCLAQTGERARALKHYERLLILLREELGAEPEGETTLLYERLRLAEPA
jgi:tetratricopeptide (TPR) repeat protein